MYFETLEILGDLVAFDTTSRNPNLELMNYIQNRLDVCGIKSDLLPNELANKANLIARIGPEAPGGILLSGHTDVVPVDGQEWSCDPWKLSESAGRLYGRGTTDMKGFIACVLSKLPAWSSCQLTKPIYLVFSYDEEIGCKGITSALSTLNQRGVSPDLCIIGEPTEQKVVSAHKARAHIWAACEATGGHASKFNDPQITSANTLAVRLCHAFDVAGKEIGNVLGDKLIGAASLAVTSWEASNTENVIPSKARVHFDFRGAAGMTEDKLLDALWSHAAQILEKYRSEKTGWANIELTAQVGNRGFHCTDVEAIKLGKYLTCTNQTGSVDYVCEAARYQEAGFTKTIICGPGSILQAHQPNESIETSQLVKCHEMLDRITSYSTKVRACQQPGLAA